MEQAKMFWERLTTVSTEDPELARKGQLFSVVAVALVAVLFPVSFVQIGLFFFLPMLPIQLMLSINAFIIVFSALSLWGVRRGRMEASYIFLIGMFILCVLATYVVGGVTGSITLIFCFPITMAGLFQGVRGGLVLATLSCAFCVAAAIGELTGLISPLTTFPENELIYVTVFAALIIFYMIAVLTWLSARGLERALKESRAHLSESQTYASELAQYKGHLESTITRYMASVTSIAQGDLTTKLLLDDEGHQDDPLIILGQNLNAMVDNLRGMTVQIKDVAHNLGEAAAEILAATTQQAAGATEQSAAITQTTATVDEVKTIADQAVVRAQEVTSMAQRTVEVSRTGQEAVQDTIESMAQIKSRVEGIAENILALSEQTQQIGEIIATVNQIATQSNMLALNAAVEAARAGEHGKGFAVVAQEVRNLADQSRQATAQVKAILQDIQQATNASVMATEEGTKGVEEGGRLVVQAQEVIAQLATTIAESAQAAAQVVAGGQQQASGIEQIALAMQQINQATMQSLTSTRQQEKAVQDLNALARSLSQTVTQYQL